MRPESVSAIDRLAFLGSDTMGALTYAPATEPALAAAELDLLDLARESRAALEEGASEDVLRHLVKMGGSPHGARPKALVNFDTSTSRMTNDASGAGAPWLVKFPAPGEHKEVCEIELLYAALAGAAKIDMPDCQSFDLGRDLSAFAIRRFDREGLKRIPTHTLAGALNANFRTPGAVDYQTFLRLTRFITNDAREVLKAFDRCVFNVIFNNRDDHAENFSYTLDANLHWQLSTAYDLTYSYGYNGEHQMDVAGVGRDISRSALLKLAANTDLRASDAKASIERICGVASEMPQMARHYQIRRQTISDMLAQVEANQRNMLK